MSILDFVFINDSYGMMFLDNSTLALFSKQSNQSKTVKLIYSNMLFLYDYQTYAFDKENNLFYISFKSAPNTIRVYGINATYNESSSSNIPYKLEFTRLNSIKHVSNHT